MAALVYLNTILKQEKLGEGGSRRFYMDVNGDNYLSSLDDLLVISELNKRENRGSEEGEQLRSLRKNGSNHVALDVGQSEIATSISVRQSFMI